MAIIFYETDFTITETIVDLSGHEIDPRSINFGIVYYTNEKSKYRASHINGNFENCYYDAEVGKLIVTFTRHGLRPGALKHKFIVLSEDGNFPLNIRYDRTLTDTNITLSITGGSDFSGESTLIIPALLIAHVVTEKNDIKDADEFNYLDSEYFFKKVKTTWQNIKLKLKDYFDARYSSVTHNHNLNNLTEKSYNSLSDKPTLDFEPANSNIQEHIADTTKHLTSTEKGQLHTHANKTDLDAYSPSLLVTSWSATPTHDNIPSEKLVKDSLDLKAEINHDHNNVYEPANANIQSHIGDGDIHVTSLQKSDFHAHTNKTALDAVDGVNTGDQSSSDFDIKDLSDTMSLRSTWSGKQDALTFSTNIETDKESTTKITAIKTFYDWAVGKFIDLAKIVTSWSAAPSDANLASEKLVKNSLDTKADITPANGNTSALRALFTSVPNANCVYNTITGYYEMNGITNLTEEQLRAAYPIVISTIDFSGLMRAINIRTNFPVQVLSYTDIRLNLSLFMVYSGLEVFAFRTHVAFGDKVYVSSLIGSFRVCYYLKKIIGVLEVSQVTDFHNSFYALEAFEQIELLGLKANIAFGQSPLLNLYTLQYMVTNRANRTTRITITVHPTVWGYLNDAVGHPEWNALLVDAVNNQYIDFASA